MYFIARNNAIYNYIAHTSLKHCYSGTLMGVCALFLFCMYGVYYPLLGVITVLESEKITLQNRYDELAQLDKSGMELARAIELGKKNIADRAIGHDKQEEHCHKRILFVLEAIAQSGVILNAYGSCKEKDKLWYIKNIAHFDITGSMQKVMTFLETIKKSHSMITISRVMITRVGDDTLQMGFDIGLITVKK